MDLSLGTLVEATREVQEEHQALGSQDRRQDGRGEQGDAVAEREHMFDKVLTPSDVGKLNRLVVPKQHAERFFPAAGAGTQLCFDDGAGVPWRFRYSYWGSSQSYVMTKGWSRFVRAARLAAGDTVSFSRNAGGGQYFIDYRHCQRRRQEISFGDAATVPAWPWVQRPSSGVTGGAGASGTNAGRHDDAEVGPSGGRSFRLFGFNVECSRDDDVAMAEEEYVDDDN
jgi:hypothetical protein